MSHLVSAQARERLVGVAALTFFISPDRAEFHLQTLAALLAASRAQDEQDEVRQGLRLAIEQAARAISPETLARVSWQGVRLPGIDLARCELPGIDFKDADLQDAHFDAATLSGANFTNAKLQAAGSIRRP